ncbi:hypothetical protein L1987_32693 [Smallanthus sonchifolius]|uniref:Uncharacterized protein n=1 Tax=Smallanthus sonchifolius TaxID=185202 RepID=A0ACB9HPM4_9ASTR|nr:hypothetical protein L1987_32693 [Smallanthus sonchifolius]
MSDPILAEIIAKKKAQMLYNYVKSRQKCKKDWNARPRYGATLAEIQIESINDTPKSDQNIRKYSQESGKKHKQPAPSPYYQKHRSCTGTQAFSGEGKDATFLLSKNHFCFDST